MKQLFYGKVNSLKKKLCGKYMSVVEQRKNLQHPKKSKERKRSKRKRKRQRKSKRKIKQKKKKKTIIRNGKIVWKAV